MSTIPASPKARAQEGVRVLEYSHAYSHALAGRYCTLLPGDYGAAEAGGVSRWERLIVLGMPAIRASPKARALEGVVCSSIHTLIHTPLLDVIARCCPAIMARP